MKQNVKIYAQYTKNINIACLTGIKSYVGAVMGRAYGCKISIRLRRNENMTKKVMSLLIVACVAMSMIGVTIGIVAYRKNKSETPAVRSLNAETATTVDRAGVKKYSVNFNNFNPNDKRSYEIVPARDLDVNLEFTKGKGKLAEVVYVTIKYGANEKTGFLKDVYGKNFELGKNAGKIEIIFEFKSTAADGRGNDRDNEYMGATADFVLKITSKTVEEVK